jgi:hypothetical protein
MIEDAVEIDAEDQVVVIEIEAVTVVVVDIVDQEIENHEEIDEDTNICS